MSVHAVYLLSAELLLVMVAVAIYLGGAFVGQRGRWSRSAVAAILAAAIVLGVSAGQPTRIGPLALDGLAYFMRWLALSAGLLLVLCAAPTSGGRGGAEYTGSLLLALVGVMLSAAADELVLLFVALELVSIPTYLLLYLGRHDPPGREATAKYFFLSLLGSALLLYGFSFLYGAAGTTHLDAIRERLAATGPEAGASLKLVKMALGLIFAGLGFKIAAVPFHFYAPDVYQGTSHANAAILSVLPKAAAMIALVRVVALAMPSVGPYAWRVALVLSLLSMTLGNLLALWQDNVRRMLAYSAIAQTGYMLIGLAVALCGAPTTPGWDGLGALLFYLCVYAAAAIGTFAALAYLGRADRQIDAVEELAGLGRTRPLVAASLGLFMFSLTGIPPLAGFWGKLCLFGSALAVEAGGAAGTLRPWFVVLAVAGVLNAALSAAYYLRIVGVMYFRAPLGTPRAEGGLGAGAAMLACAALVLGLGLHSGPLVRAAMDACPTRHLGLPRAEVAASAPAGQTYQVPVTSSCHRNRK